MRALLPATLFVPLVMLLAAGCPPTTPAGEGEGEGAAAEGEGEGAAGEGEGEGAGEGEGEGQAGEGEGEGEGGGCQVDGDCGVDQTCQSIFTAGAKACFNTCPTLADPCTTLTGATGTCGNFNNAALHVCFANNADRLPCGNNVNAECADDAALCVTLGDNSHTPQNEHLLAFCLVGCTSNADCTAAGEACSQDIHFHLASDPATSLGVCALTSTAGDACSITPDLVDVCTDGQVCTIPDGTNAGLCQ